MPRVTLSQRLRHRDLVGGVIKRSFPIVVVEVSYLVSERVHFYVLCAVLWS